MDKTFPNKKNPAGIKYIQNFKVLKEYWFKEKTVVIKVIKKIIKV